MGQRETPQEFESIVIRRNPGQAPLYLGDLAKVYYQLEETGAKVRFDGKPAVILRVKRTGDEDAIEIASAVKNFVKKRSAELPDTLTLASWQDNTVSLRGRISLLKRNGQFGVLLVFIVLALFLRPSLAFWVTLGIPISFLGTFCCYPLWVSLSICFHSLALYLYLE